MTVLFELKDLTIPGLAEQLNLQLETGMTAFLITSDDQESDLLFRILLGEQMPESGAVMFEGQCLHGIDRNELLKIRRTIGTVAARTNLISNLKVWENVTLPQMYHNGSLTAEAADQAMQLLEEAGLLQNIWALPGHLSAAERIMAACIRAVISAPKLLIVAAYLDDLTGLQRKTFLRMLTGLQNSNAAPAALFITADPIQLPQLQPDITVDLRQHPALVTRKS